MGGCSTRRLGVTPSGPITDPNFASTILLCGCEGTNGTDANLDDESFANHANGVSGGSGATDTSYDTSQKVFGSSSAHFAGFNDFIRFADHADWTLGTSNFTIEFFWRNEFTGDLTRVMDFISHYNASTTQRGWQIQHNGGVTPKKLNFVASPDGTSVSNIISADWAPSNATWYYICAERSGNVFRLYVGEPGGNTTMIGTVTNAISLFNSSAQLQISGNPASEAETLGGWMDEIRITTVARYATDAGYPVPSVAFPRS